MSNRHLARTIVMQILYQWDFKNKPSSVLPAITEQILDEFGVGLDENKTYVMNTVNGVIDHMAEIDEKIDEYATNWPLEQIAIVDRNVLRIGIYELIINQDIPAKVAINEAIEVAKAFGGQSSGKFVNGILGAMYRDMQDTEAKNKKQAE